METNDTDTSHVCSNVQCHAWNQACVCHRRKSHGNRKLQHFRRKCRARSKNDAININQSTVEKKLVKSHKRKRSQPIIRANDGVAKSMSQLSVSQPSPKRRKEKAIEFITNDANARTKSKRSVVEENTHVLEFFDRD